MKKQWYLYIIIVCCSLHTARAQDSTRYYEYAYAVIDSMLSDRAAPDFKKAVLACENAYFDGKLDYASVERSLRLLHQLVGIVRNTDSLRYDGSDRYAVATNAAIFRVMTDSVTIVSKSFGVYVHKPYSYNFDDMWGQKDWSDMFVSGLLKSNTGNCHSLPFLYKILAEDFGVPAYLALVPNHIYIKNYCKKTGWYNTELTSAAFPVDAWIMASGYVSLDAVRNGLYMDTLGLRQSVAYCLLDLAQGYQRKFGTDNPDFTIRCCNRVLEYHPANVNAMLTRAEAQKRVIAAIMKSRGITNPVDISSDAAVRDMYSDMEATYARLYELGYRRMPEDMYIRWLELLRHEQEKYIDKKMIHSFDN